MNQRLYLLQLQLFVPEKGLYCPSLFLPKCKKRNISLVWSNKISYRETEGGREDRRKSLQMYLVPEANLGVEFCH